MTDQDHLSLLLTASRAELMERDSAAGRAIESDAALRTGAELVVAAETAMVAAWTAPRGPIDVGALVSRRKRRWFLRGSGLLYWGCAVPFAVFALLATLYGLGMLAFLFWISR